jgi:hypothetical protein
MRFFSASTVTLFTVLSGTVVEAAPPVKELAARASTCNTPSNRACWTTGFDINTDYEAKTPTTGVTRQYSLSITEVDNWTGPDGVVKSKVMLVNGKCHGLSSPIVTITDTSQTNSLQDLPLWPTGAT